MSRNKGTGSIYYREDRKVYEGKIQTAKKYNGKPIYKYITRKTKKEVQDELVRIIAQVNEGTYFEPSKMPLWMWMDKWMEVYERDNIREQTYESYKQTIRTKITPFIGDVKLNNLTPMMVQQMFNELSKSFSPATLRKAKSVLRMAISQAIDNELIVKDPTRGLKLPGLPKPEIGCLTDTEIFRLLKVAKGRNIYELLYTDFSTGMRVGETLALDWLDVNLKKEELKVHKTLVRVKGDNNKETLKIQDIPKTHSSNRTVPMSKNNVQLLKELRKKRLAKGLNDNGIVFCSTRGTRIHPRNVNRDLESICKKAGIRKISIHVSRHSFATNAIECGAEVKTVSDIIGHSKIETTYNNYVHPSKEKKKEVAEMMSIRTY